MKFVTFSPFIIVISITIAKNSIHSVFFMRKCILNGSSEWKRAEGGGREGILHQREIRITTEASTIPLKSLRAPPHRDAIISRNQQTKWMKKEDNLYDELMFGAKRRRKWAPIRLLPIAMLAMRIIFYSRCWFILQLSIPKCFRECPELTGLAIWIVVSPDLTHHPSITIRMQDVRERGRENCFQEIHNKLKSQKN